MLKGDLEELRRRKEELLIESDINRQILRVEFCQLKLKADDWKQSVSKGLKWYKWLAPAAGIAATFYGVKKQMSGRGRGSNNGLGGKAAMLNLLAPVAFAAARKAMAFWKAKRSRAATEM